MVDRESTRPPQALHRAFRPGHQVPGGGEAAHLQADLGDDGVRGSQADPGDLIQLGRSVPLNEPEQDRRLRWWAWRFTRELPPLTVEGPSVWHTYGTSHRTAASSSAG